jgi:FMN phosphatase YigB (HAD superfamily)
MPTLICDLGGVLLAEADPQRRIDAWSSMAGAAVGVACGAQLLDDASRAFETGHLSEDEYLAHLHDRLGWAGSREDLLRGWAEGLGAVNLDVLEVLSGLRQKGWQLIGAADMCSWDQRTVGEQYGWSASLFDRIVTSTGVGARRPDPRFFAELRGAAGAGSRLYVDDEAHNVAGARRAGLDAHLFTSVASLQSACRQLVVSVN